MHSSFGYSFFFSSEDSPESWFSSIVFISSTKGTSSIIGSSLFSTSSSMKLSKSLREAASISSSLAISVYPEFANAVGSSESSSGVGSAGSLPSLLSSSTFDQTFSASFCKAVGCDSCGASSTTSVGVSSAGRT